MSCALQIQAPGWLSKLLIGAAAWQQLRHPGSTNAPNRLVVLDATLDEVQALLLHRHPYAFQHVYPR